MSSSASTSDVELRIPAKAEYLSLVRAVVAAAAGLEPSLADERIENLRLAVSEATTNAIEAHADLGSDERIVIRCQLDDDQIEIEVQDKGEGFDPETLVSLPSVAEPDRLTHERGLGIPLMRTFTDLTEIRSLETGTSVRLVVYTSAHESA